MMVTFPHLGPMALAAAQFFSYLGIPFIVPPENDQETLERGASISPEEMCIPFKYMVGNLKAAYEAGADTAVMAATCGPCRLGEYGELLKMVLEKDNCPFRWILLDSPSAIGGKEFLRRLNLLIEENGIASARLTKGLADSVRMIHKMDSLRSFAGKKAGFLEHPYEAVRILRETDERLKAADSFHSCFEIIRTSRKRLRNLPTKQGQEPIRILIAGEIYTSIEPEANGRLEEKLMMCGCSVTRHIDISWWLRHTIMDALVPAGMLNKAAGKKGIPCNVGGYGRETIRKILKSPSFDGVIKIMPSGCMPEIVTKAFCETLQEETDYRILHLIYDEMSGKAGYETRIEAFVDMLERRKNVLAGNRHRLHKHRSGHDQ